MIRCQKLLKQEGTAHARRIDNLLQPPKTKDVGRGLRKIVACSQSSSQCLLVATVFGTVSCSLVPRPFFAGEGKNGRGNTVRACVGYSAVKYSVSLTAKYTMFKAAVNNYRCCMRKLRTLATKIDDSTEKLARLNDTHTLVMIAQSQERVKIKPNVQ